jgi:hypothetical protein
MSFEICALGFSDVLKADRFGFRFGDMGGDVGRQRFEVLGTS